MPEKYHYLTFSSLVNFLTFWFSPEIDGRACSRFVHVMSVSAIFWKSHVRVRVRVRDLKVFHVRVRVRVRDSQFCDVRVRGHRCPCPPISGTHETKNLEYSRISDIFTRSDTFEQSIGRPSLVSSCLLKQFYFSNVNIILRVLSQL